MSAHALYCVCGWGGADHALCPRCGGGLFTPEAVALMPDSVWAPGQRPVELPRMTSEVMPEEQFAQLLERAQEVLGQGGQGCVVCGQPGEVEPRFGYVVCTKHDNIPPAQIHQTTKASS